MAYSIDVEDVLGTERDEKTGTVLVQLGDVAGEQATSQGAELWSPSGFASRPAAPTPGQEAAQALVMKTGSRDVCLGFRDVRAQQIYGNLEAGEACIYASSGQARVLCKADGSIVAYTTEDNTDTGRGVFMRLGPDGLRFEAPWGRITWDATGFHVIDHSGARFDMGGIGGIPSLGPLSISSYCTMSASLCHVDGESTLLGAGNVHLPVVSIPIEMATSFPAGGLSVAAASVVSSAVRVAAPVP
jgi:hypothetical protein